MRYSQSILVIFLLTLPFVTYGLEQESGSGEKEYTFFKGEKTTIKNPFELRDPFKEEPIKRGSKKKSQSFSANEIVEGNLFSNVPSVDTISSIDKIRVVGVLLGKERRALIKIGNEKGKDILILKEGMKVGPDNIELKAVLPGGVVFVEKIRNVYDQDEYLETVIPVSAE